jgi:hypothetical protein
LHSHRTGLESLHGKANALIFDSIRHAPLHDTPGDFNRSLIRKNHILLTTGVDLYINIWTLRAQADSAHTLFGNLLPNISPTSLAELINSDLPKNLKAIRERLGKDGNIFERVGSSAVSLIYPEMEWEDMEEVFEKLNIELGEMKTELGDIVDKLQSMDE